MKIICLFVSIVASVLTCFAVPDVAPTGWSTAIVRDEIAPTFRYEPQGGPAHDGAFVIESD